MKTSAPNTPTQLALKAPFPWFGGKSKVAPLVWERFGRVRNYVEPFAGSLAVLLGAPDGDRIETVNDIDGFISNFWRAVAAAPDEVAKHCDWPVNEADLHARHVWLLAQREDLTAHLMGDPDFFDAKVAGWWCWGISCWIGGGWCSGNGPWISRGGRLVKDTTAQGVRRQRVHLSSVGQCLHRKLAHLGDAGRGVHRKLAHPDNGDGLYAWFDALASRLRGVRVACGDWQRVCGPSVTYRCDNRQLLTGVFLDPPYSATERDPDIYSCDSEGIAAKVREWAISEGDNPLMRIALCGYDTEHTMPDGWTAVRWKACGGYGSQGDKRGKANRSRETIWFSPHCLTPRQRELF